MTLPLLKSNLSLLGKNKTKQMIVETSAACFWNFFPIYSHMQISTMDFVIIERI